MNSKIESVYKDISLRAEYDINYSEKSTKLKLLLLEAIASNNQKLLQRVTLDAKQIKDLQYLFDEDIDILKLYFASNVASLIETSMKNGLPKDVAVTAKKKCYSEIAHCDNKKQLINNYLLIEKDLFKLITQYSMINCSPIVKMAIEYIHNNKFRFIFAKDVANAIKANRSYLSKKFKDETGETITNYIHKTKVELAIELMESNIYKYNEIAELLGYKNYSYFSKVFKNITSKTPYEYLKNEIHF